MFRSFSTAFLLFAGLFTDAQSVLRTVIPVRPVVAGTSFQVQYIQESGTQAYPLVTPDFRNFKKIAGPYAYTGSDPQGRTVFNTVYTLVAQKPGRFIIPGAVVQVAGKPERSSDMVLEVISPEEAEQKARAEAGKTPTAYYLAPGEDPQQKIRQNLFVKVTADKRSCYPGEPVVAEFKLYSRLESRSDITRNPGFYGFTVYDMVSLNDQQQTTETVNGKLFSVHTIRKVQLFPQHEGRFVIDAMQIKHTVEFSTVNTSKPTEQQIAEGVLQQNTNDEPEQAGMVSYESVTETQPVQIEVLPLPAGKPQGFSGATGQFSIHAELMKSGLDLHEEGVLQLSISGKGNFTQFSIPVMEWPAGLEGFEPVITDSIGKNSVPLSGTRFFRYPFIASKPGTYTIPAFTFVSFDPVKKTYTVQNTTAFQLSVSTHEKKNAGGSPVVQNATVNSDRNWLLFALPVFLLVTGIAVFLFLRRRKVKPVLLPVTAPMQAPEADPLQPAREAVQGPASLFCTALHQSAWHAVAGLLKSSDAILSKQVLRELLMQAEAPVSAVNDLFRVMETCEAVAYAGADMQQTPAEMLAEAERCLDELRKTLL